MTHLLDTHVWLWMLSAPERLGTGARSIVEDPRQRLLLSAASSWEIAVKYGTGRLSLPEPPERYVPKQMHRSGVEGLAVEHSHALRVAALAPHHRDPFDRLLLAQSQVESLPIITADPAFAAYDVEVVDAS